MKEELESRERDFEKKERFANFKNIELSDIETYINKYPKEYENYLKVEKEVD